MLQLCTPVPFILCWPIRPLPLAWFLVPSNSSQDINIPHHFNTINLNDSNNSNWYMDFGAISHIYVATGVLKSFSNKCNLSLILFCHGSCITVTHSRPMNLTQNTFRTSPLKDFIITPQIIEKSYFCPSI